MNRPYKLITVSRDSDKATKMVRALAEVLGDRHCIIHAANCESKWQKSCWTSSLTWEGLDEIKSRTGAFYITH